MSGCRREHLVTHWFCQAFGKCVLLARMKRGNEGQVPECVRLAVAEFRPPLEIDPPRVFERVECGIETDFAKANDYCDIFQELDFLNDVRPAILNLFR